jgi:hypothetical protein
MQIPVKLLTAVVILAATTALAEQPLYTFDEAFQRGIVSMKSDGSAEEATAAISHLREIDPGMVSGFAFFFGGPTQQELDSVAPKVASIREQVPKAILAGGFPESVSNGYNQNLRCGASPVEHHFDVDKLTSHHQQLKSDVWIDPAKSGFVEYYDCIAKTYIDDGITAFLFEAPSLMIPASGNPAAAGKAFETVADNVHAYATGRGQKVYFFGEAALTKYVHIDAVYLPARYYHTTIEQKYQNRIARPGIGVGYSYALSPLMVKDTLASVPPGTKAIFVAVDHWDSKQDDLRRFMELDADNRRYLIQQSAKNARRYGALFMPALDACGGCNAPDIVVDPCEKLTRGSSVITEYSAVRCEDLSAIRDALHSR